MMRVMMAVIWPVMIGGETDDEGDMVRDDGG